MELKKSNKGFTNPFGNDEGKKSHKNHGHGHKWFSSHKPSTSKSKEEKHEKSSVLNAWGRSHIASQCPSKKTMICVDGVYHSTSSFSNDTSSSNSSSCEASSSDEDCIQMKEIYLW